MTRYRPHLMLIALVLLGAATACNDPAPPPTAPPDPALQGRLVPLNGTELFVAEVGTGEPVIVVHGGPVMDHSYIAPFLTPLADTYRLVFYDQRLSGRSSADVDTAHVRMTDFIADLDAVRGHIGAERFHLVGHSWGAHIAMRYAIAHPEALRSLVLLNPMPASMAQWQEEEARLATRITAADSLERQRIMASQAFADGEPSAIEALQRVAFRAQFHTPERVADLPLYVPDDYLTRSQRFGGLMPDLIGYDLHEGLRGLEVPTLIVYGADEPAATIGGRSLAGAIPGAERVVIPEAGHFPFLEQPDAFLGAVRPFLARP